MKKLLIVTLSILSLSVMAQVPQGVGYQGVATDANGIELVNQAISIRASVLSGSATGTIEWEETHSTTTDTFGLFTLTIGQGTNTTIGAQTSFADISWGTNTHYLKIEMDVTGGSNYSFMGTNQMMSVPYALYAANAGLDSTTVANMIADAILTAGGGAGSNLTVNTIPTGPTCFSCNDGYIMATATGGITPYTYAWTNGMTGFIAGNLSVGSYIVFVTDANGNIDSDTVMLTCPSCLFGCTDSTMWNYNPLANTDDGTCMPYLYGCTDSVAFNYDSIPNTNDNSCCYIAGCTDPTATNYMSNACHDDGSCGLDFYSSSQSFLPSGTYNNVIISVNDIVNITPNATTTLTINDTCWISGDIIGNGNIVAACTQQYLYYSCPPVSTGAITGGGAKGGGYSGGNWGSTCNSSPEPVGGSITSATIHGGHGGRSFYWFQGNVYCGANGGEGGAGLIINCEVLIFDGLIELNGGNGGGCGQNQYGSNAGGGGGGGSLRILTDEIITNTGIINTNGGAGGGCSNTPPYAMTPGSAGGNGLNSIIEY